MDSIQLEYKGKTFELKQKKCTLKLRDEIRKIRYEIVKTAEEQKALHVDNGVLSVMDSLDAGDRVNIDGLVKMVQAIGEPQTDDAALIKAFKTASDSDFWGNQDYIQLLEFANSFRTMAHL